MQSSRCTRGMAQTESAPASGDRATLNSRYRLRFLLACLLLAPLASCGVAGPANGPNTSTSPPSAELTGPSTAPEAVDRSSDVKQPAADETAADETAADETAPDETAPDETAADATTDSVRLQVAGVEEYRKTLEQLRGQVVLVDFWATWCIPCVQQFPHTVELSQNHRDQGLAVISVSMDDPSEQAKVLQFLKNRHADFHNILGKYGAGTEFAESFDLRGDVPFYKLYDRQGQLRYQFSAEPEGIENGKPISELDQYVKQLLAEDAP